jgi:Leucine-rich repeat (LRR) protein
MTFLKNNILLLLLMLSVNFLSGQCNPVSDSLALVSIYNNSLGDSWTNKTNWLVPGRKISTWFGVKTNAAGCVESISLPSNKMNGFLPNELGDLTALKTLTLTNNNLSGNLPTTIGNLKALEEINLSSNKLNGPVHAQFGSLPKLRKLILNQNNFSGNLPSSLGNLSELTIMHLHQNNLNGPLPAALGKLANLEELLLSQNFFTGTIPPDFGNCKKLKFLILSQNNISGSIPAEIGGMTELNFFYADENQLTGTIPSAIGNLSNLRELWLHRNKLSGPMPTQITQLLKLQKLLLNENQLSGIIPQDIGKLEALVSLHLADNMLTGGIPTSIGSLKNLISLLLNKNMISGSLPASFTRLTSLNSLDISDNKVSGELPEDFGNLISLKRIYCSNNLLEGCFPKSMQRFCTLSESTNANANGYNFRGNANLIFQGDFKRWCSGEGRAKAVIASNSPLCEGSELKLTGEGGISFTWTGPGGFTATGKSVTIPGVTENQFGKYILAVVNENRCKDTTFTNVTSVSPVSVSGKTVICEGDTILLKALGGLSYAWTGPNGFQSQSANPVIPGASPSMAGEYFVEITTNDCVIKKSLTISFTKTATITSNSPVCEGDTLIISVSNGSSFKWRGPDNFTASTPEIKIAGTKPSGEGLYAVTVVNENNCAFTLETPVKINARQMLEAELVSGICDEDASLSLPAEVDGYAGTWSGTGVVADGLKFAFNPDGLNGQKEIVFSPSDARACVSRLKKNIFVSAVDITAAEERPSLNEADNNGAALVNIQTNRDNVQINYFGPQSGSIPADGSSLILTDLPSGQYLIIASDNLGCKDSATVDIRYLKASFYLPNVVVAGGSGDNGAFYLKGQNVFSYGMKIYDRWGGQVFAEDDLAPNINQSGWIPEKGIQGVFVWVLTLETFEGTRMLTGTLSVL